MATTVLEVLEAALLAATPLVSALLGGTPVAAALQHCSYLACMGMAP